MEIYKNHITKQEKSNYIINYYISNTENGKKITITYANYNYEVFPYRESKEKYIQQKMKLQVINNAQELCKIKIKHFNNLKCAGGFLGTFATLLPYLVQNMNAISPTTITAYLSFLMFFAYSVAAIEKKEIIKDYNKCLTYLSTQNIYDDVLSNEESRNKMVKAKCGAAKTVYEENNSININNINKLTEKELIRLRRFCLKEKYYKKK